ncbi:MAG: DoxX family membrane protein [Bacteroidetes bacterium]|nr:DoxX family membrane protein [Bacteroidota bacterium]
MKNYIPTNIARILFALTMVFFGLGHLTNAQAMSGMLAGWPMALFLVYLSGACLILAGVAFVINKQVKLAGYLLALLLVIIVAAVHAPGMGNADKMASMMSTSMAVKDMAIAMGAIAFANQAES